MSSINSVLTDDSKIAESVEVSLSETPHPKWSGHWLEKAPHKYSPFTIGNECDGKAKIDHPDSNRL